ncbi:hypothetical protein BMS3Abin16_00635 [archaeon BMS3Abin16]|nr:hypothetical protein BMS3Abin16_00635 [archaeon BMS3Abin16]
MEIAEGYEVEGVDICGFDNETHVLEVFVECKREVVNEVGSRELDNAAEKLL